MMMMQVKRAPFSLKYTHEGLYTKIPFSILILGEPYSYLGVAAPYCPLQHICPTFVRGADISANRDQPAGHRQLW